MDMKCLHCEDSKTRQVHIPIPLGLIYTTISFSKTFTVVLTDSLNPNGPGDIKHVVQIYYRSTRINHVELNAFGKGCLVW